MRLRIVKQEHPGNGDYDRLVFDHLCQAGFRIGEREALRPGGSISLAMVQRVLATRVDWEGVVIDFPAHDEHYILTLTRPADDPLTPEEQLREIKRRLHRRLDVLKRWLGRVG